MDPESSVTGNKRCSLSFRPWVAMVPGCFYRVRWTRSVWDAREERLTRRHAWRRGGVQWVGVSVGVFTPLQELLQHRGQRHTHTRDALRSCAFCDAKQLQVIKIPPPSNLLNNTATQSRHLKSCRAPKHRGTAARAVFCDIFPPLILNSTILIFVEIVLSPIRLFSFSSECC